MKLKTVREPIATWYRVDKYKINIEPVSVAAFTEKTVTILRCDWRGHKEENRNAIHSAYYDFYPTWGEAHAALIQRWEYKVKSAQSNLQNAQYNLQQLRVMNGEAA